MHPSRARMMKMMVACNGEGTVEKINKTQGGVKHCEAMHFK